MVFVILWKTNHGSWEFVMGNVTAYSWNFHGFFMGNVFYANEYFMGICDIMETKIKGHCDGKLHGICYGKFHGFVMVFSWACSWQIVAGN